MKRLLLLVLLVSVLFGATASVDAQIAKTRRQIDMKAQEIRKINSILDESGRQIKEQQKAIVEVEAKRVQLEGQATELKGHKQVLVGTMNQMEALKQEAIRQKEQIEKQLVRLVAKELSFSAVFGESESLSEEEMIKEAFYERFRQTSRLEIDRLKHDYIEKQRTIQLLSGRMVQIKSSIQAIVKKEDELLQMRQRKQQLITKLGETTKSYKAKLERLLKEQDAARNTLERLNVLRKRQTQPAPKSVQDSAAASGSDTIKQYGSAYFQMESAHYTGPKVQGPLEGATVVKAFGPYNDPVYNIRIHNDYVMLRPASADAMVKAVLEGRVVYAKEVPSLGRVVILEHGGGLATIYAHLAKIAPTMSVGRHVSRGKVVGRVGGELMFEVTKNGIPVNPMELITR